MSSPALWTNFRVMKAAPKFVAECLQRSGALPIHVSFEWDSSDPNYGSPSTSVAEDDGSVEGDGDDCMIAEDSTNEVSSSRPEDSDDGTSSHSVFSIYPDHRDVGYSWTAYIKEAQGYHHLMQHSLRIATLDISLPAPGNDEEEEEDNSFAYGLLLYPFPALQTFKLRGFRGSHGSIPKIILDEHIATVNSLFLEDIIPTQVIDLALNLTSLTLRTTRLNTLIDTGSFLRCLEKNRNLQSLTLYNYNFPLTPESITPIALNDLRQLDVSTESAKFLRHLAAPSLGPQSSFSMGIVRRCLSLSAENNTSGTSASVSCPVQSTDPNLAEFLSLLSEVFGSGWEDATQVVVVIPVGGWERELVDQFLDRLTRLSDLSVEYNHIHVDPWFGSLAASKERCPKLRRIRLLNIAPECCPTAFRSIRKLVKRRAEDGIPLEMVEQTGLSPSMGDVWDDLYDRWRVKDFLRAEDP